MKIKYVTLGLLCAISISACSPKPPEKKPDGVLSDAQKQVLESAQETEDNLKKADEECRKKLEEMEGE